MQNTNDAQAEIDHKLLKTVLTPSWLSGLVAVTAGLAVTIGIILAFTLTSSQAQQQLIGWESTSSSQPALTLPTQSSTGNNRNSLQNTWPLLAFWGVIGTIVYFVVETAIKASTRAAEFREELHYLHIRREALIRNMVLHVLLRILIGVLWLFFINLFFKRIIPYSITAANASTSGFDINAFLYAFISFFLIAGSLHLHAVFLRLVLGRPRAFSSVNYT